MPERPRAVAYRNAQRFRRVLSLLLEAVLNPRSLVRRLRKRLLRPSLYPQSGLSWRVLVVLTRDLPAQQRQALERFWPDARWCVLPLGDIGPRDLLCEARAVAADYVLILANSSRLDAALLANLCRLVACNPGYDAWLSGARVGFWSWDFRGFDLDPEALLLLRCSLLDQQMETERHRRNATRLLPVSRREVFPPLNRFGAVRHATSFSSQEESKLSTLSNLLAALPLAQPRLHRMPTTPRLVAVIPTRDHSELLAAAVASLCRQELPMPLELLVVDNGSEEPATAALLAQLSNGSVPFRCIRDARPFNFSALCNSGIAASDASLVLLLNNDVVFSHPKALAAMLQLVQLETVGCVGACLNYPDGRVQHLGVELSGELVQHQAYGVRLKPDDPLLQRPRQVAAVTAACMVIRRSLWDELAGFDEDLPVDFNDVDFCLRAQAAGFANLIVPVAQATHLESVSRGRLPHPSFAASLKTMKIRWGKHIGSDPYALLPPVGRVGQLSGGA